MVTHPLIIFDSGIGGFSILKELIGYDVPLLYFADQANFPYGDKSSTFLKSRFLELADIFSEKKLSGLVVACNTGTVTSIKELRNRLAIPVFGVEPVTKVLKDYKNPIIWGTKVTTNSVVANSLRESHGSHIRYYTPVGLAAAIEADNMPEVKRILDYVKTEIGEIDAIGLSCTHYPLVKDMIESVFAGVKVYDPSSAVASHVARTLKLTKKNKLIPKTQVEYQSTGSMLRLQQLASKYGLL